VSTAVGEELARPKPAAEELLAALASRTPPPPARVVALLRTACRRADTPRTSDATLIQAIDAWLAPLRAALHGPWSGESHRRRSTATAILAASILEQAEPASVAAAFASGLMLKVGQLALYYCFPKGYSRAISGAATHRDGILGAERAVLGVDHTLAGKRLAESWGLPALVRDVLWQLHHPGPSGDPAQRSICAAVRQADQQVRRAAIGWPDFLPLGVQGNAAYAHDQLGVAIDDLLRRSAELPDVPREESASPPAKRIPVSRPPATAAWRSVLLDFLAMPAGGSVADVCAAVARSAQRLVGTTAAAAFAAGPQQQTWVGAVRELDNQSVRIPMPADLARLLNTTCDAADSGPIAAPDELIRAHGALARSFAARNVPTRMLPLRHDGCLVGGVLFPDAPNTNDTPIDWVLVSAAFARIIAMALETDAQRHLAESLALNHADGKAAAPAGTFSPLAAMAAGAAHELNTPLAVIAGRAQILRLDATDPRVRQDLSLISEHAQRASAIVSELLACAKPEPPQPRDVVLRAWLDQQRQHWEASFPAPAVHFDIRISDDALQVHADPRQIGEAFAALIANAIEAQTSRPAHVAINSHSQPTDDTIVVSIGDHGCGMAPDVLARACDPFFSHRPAGRSRGLGLSRAVRLIEINRGRLWIDSTPGVGSEVHVALPAGAPSTSAC